MNSAQLRENIDDNLENLKRCHEICINGYDRVSLKNMAHALRIWVDMRNHVQSYMNVNIPSVLFEKYSITKKANSLLRDCEFVVTAFPGRVTTIVDSSEGSNISILSKSGPPSANWQFFMRTQLGPEDTRKLRIDYMIFLTKVTEALSKDTQNTVFYYSKVKFDEWLEAEAMRIGAPDESGKIKINKISRRELIDRMSNLLGGSHPIGNSEINKEFDDVIKSSMVYTVSALPLPYFVLLKIAQDILRKFNYIKNI